MPVYDRETGKAMEFEDSGEMTRAVGSGQFGFKKGSKVNVFDPASPDDVKPGFKRASVNM